MFGTVSASPEAPTTTDVLLLGTDGKLPKGLGRSATEPEFQALVASDRARKPGNVTEAIVRNRRVLVVAIGEAARLEHVGTVGRRLASIGVTSARLFGRRLDAVLWGTGLGLLGWSDDRYRGSATANHEEHDLTVVLGSPGEVAAFDRGVSLAGCVNLARNLSQTPPNIATPDYMAHQAELLANAYGLSCRVIRGKELEVEGLTGLVNVGKASENPPCFIRLEYRPESATEASPLVLIGKTITYDTGGLSLKTRESMVGMKRDKDGGCAVLGAMKAIATIVKPNRPVVALLVAAENCVSDEAYRPDDVLTYRNGVTVEVTNTDAEGRLVLADGLCWACENENPAAIVDIATLTGGVVVALGDVFAGLFSNNEALASRIENLGRSTGERVWRLPLDPEYAKMMRSPIADIVNSVPNRKAHPVQGATFLEHFVSTGVPWAHLDIAGVHATEKDKGVFIPGPTGFGVRLLAALAERF